MSAQAAAGEWLTLTDGHVTLRRPQRADVDALVDAVQSSLALLWPWAVWATPAYGVEEANSFLDTVDDGREVAFVVTDRGGAFHGVCGLNQIAEIHRTANLGYWLRTDAAGAGRATRAARLVLVHGLQDLRLERIEVVMSVANEPSRAVAERLGIGYEGVRRRALRVGDAQHDAHVYATFREDLARLRQ